MAREKSKNSGKPSHLSAEFVVESDEDATAGGAGTLPRNVSQVSDRSQDQAHSTQGKPGKGTGARPKARADTKTKPTHYSQGKVPHSLESDQDVCTAAPSSSHGCIPSSPRRKTRRKEPESVAVTRGTSNENTAQEPLVQRPSSAEMHRSPVSASDDDEPGKLSEERKAKLAQNLDLVRESSTDLEGTGARQRVMGPADEG